MIRDISMASKPKSAMPVVKRAGQYIATMKAAGKAPASVTLAAKDYDALFRSMESSRLPHEDPVTGLRYGETPVVRAGA